jgi:CO/xanthine dehydrogenase Mo-binding subunit
VIDIASGSAAVEDLGRDARDRVAGRLRYVIDTALPGMAFAALVRSPVPAARLRSVDAARGRGMPGVLAVVSGADVAAAGLAAARFGTSADQPILPIDRVSHVGEPVAVVVAESSAAALAAAAAVRLDLEPTTPVLDPTAGLAPGAPLVREDRADNVLSRWVREHGDLVEARARSVRTFVGRFASPAAQQASLEPHVCLASWDGGRLDVWSTSQNPSRVADELAKMFGLEAGSVAVHVPPLGGGYGGKNQAKLEPLAAFAARVAGRPVKLVNRRADEFVTVTKHPADITIESGVDADGRFTFRTAEIRWSSGAYALSSVPVARAGGLAVLGPYRIPAAAVESLMVYTNHPPAGSFRGLGVSQAAWAGEQQVDVVARAIGADPVDFRRANLVRSGERLWTGERVADAHWAEALDAAVEGLAGLERAHPEPDAGSPAEGAVRRGTGVAVAMKHTITPARSEADVALLPDGRFEIRTSAVDMGQGVEVVIARIAADALGVATGRVVVLRPDTGRTPFDATTSSSRATFAVGSAVETASADLLERIVERASVVLGVPPDRLSRTADCLEDRASGRSVDLAAVAAAAPTELVGHGTFVNEPERDPDTGEPVSSSHWHQGAVALEAAVDVDTGGVRVERAAGGAWAGRVVNVPGARLQNEGNIIFGLGPALFEELAFPDGRPAVTTLLDYRLPTIADVPAALTTTSLERPADAGAHVERHGLGESLIPAVAPALANAVAAATGARVREMPISPERVLVALDEAGEADGERP